MCSLAMKSLPWIANKSIIISGGGISGLSFAIALYKSWSDKSTRPNITIYERDSYEEQIGREGYTLSLRIDERGQGIQVLNKLGLYDNILDAAVGSGGSMNFWNRTFDSVLLNVRESPITDVDRSGKDVSLHAVRIRRNSLQKVLADAATELGIALHWNTSVTGAERGQNDQMRVALSTNTTLACDLLLACDGSRSKLRESLIPDHGLDFANCVAIAGTARFSSPSAVPAPLTKDWGMFLNSSNSGPYYGGLSTFVAPVDNTSALWSFSYLSPHQRATKRAPLPSSEIQSLLTEAQTYAAAFSPTHSHLVAHTDPSTIMVFNAVDRPPFAHTPDLLSSTGNVIFLGDANHAVSPFAGNGANMALRDGWDLAECLVNATSLEEAAKEYDERSVPRSQETLRMSRWGITMAHAQGWRLWGFMWVLRVVGWWIGLGRRV